MDEERKQELTETNEVPASQSNNPLTRALVVCEDGTITSSKCHLCMSKYRAKIEEMFDRNMSLSVIKNFLDENNEPYPLWRLKAHFDNHYKNMQLQAAALEYRDRLDEVMKRRNNMVEDIEHSIAISWIELSNVIGMNAPDLDKQEKKQRIIAGIQKTILENHNFIKSLHDLQTEKRASEERFAKVWLLKLEEAKTEEERKLLFATLEDFKKKILQQDA